MEKVEKVFFKILEKIKLVKIVDWYKSHIEVMRYLIFGVLTTAINIISYSIFYYFLGIENIISNVIAWIVSVIFAYLTNRKYVFESKANTIKTMIVEIFSFFASRLVTLGIDEAIMYVTVDKWQWNGLLMKILSNILVIILNFIFSKLIVFKKNRGKL